MMELKKYVTSKYMVIEPFLDVRCFGVRKELCTDRKEVRLVRYTYLN
ncbi:MAG: hypothetical protein ACP5I3_09780 [Thermoproteus sp.]